VTAYALLVTHRTRARHRLLPRLAHAFYHKPRPPHSADEHISACWRISACGFERDAGCRSKTHYLCTTALACQHLSALTGYCQFLLLRALHLPPPPAMFSVLRRLRRCVVEEHRVAQRTIATAAPHARCGPHACRFHTTLFSRTARVAEQPWFARRKHFYRQENTWAALRCHFATDGCAATL